MVTWLWQYVAQQLTDQVLNWGGSMWKCSIKMWNGSNVKQTYMGLQLMVQW